MIMSVGTHRGSLGPIRSAYDEFLDTTCSGEMTLKEFVLSMAPPRGATRGPCHEYSRAFSGEMDKGSPSENALTL
jgi:hypothetical protein